MWLSTFFLCLFSISQWIPFAVAIMDDDIINYLEGHVRNWRGIYCAFCLQVVEHPGTDLPFDDATTGMIKEEIVSNYSMPRFRFALPRSCSMWKAAKGPRKGSGRADWKPHMYSTTEMVHESIGNSERACG